MRSGLLLSASVLIAAFSVVPAYADAITDSDAVNYQAAAASLPGGIGAALFDAGGLPFLLTSDPTYLQLTSRGKLRGGTNNNNDTSDGGAVGFFVSAGLSADSGGGSNDGGSNDGGSNAGADNGVNAGGDGSGEGFAPADSGDSKDGGGLPDDSGAAAVPEPASMFLLGPAALLALRRRNRK